MDYRELLKGLADKKKKARESLIDYMRIIKKDYNPAWFHEVMCEELTEFAFSGKREYKMLFVPPQNGKSLHSTLGLPTFLLGLDPKLKIAVISYNNEVASLFGDDISRILKSDDYKSVFPNTVTGVAGLKDNKYITETTEGGYIISVGVNGTLTSRTVDIFIFDDLYKGATDAWSVAYRKKVWNFYNTVAETRGHKKEKMLILYTKWHEDDLAGRLVDLYPEKWSVTTFQGIKTADFNHSKDPREIGEILWKERHSLDKYLDLKERDEVAFEALIQQNPTPVRGLMYPDHKVWDLSNIEEIRGIKKFYVDTADTGKDYLTAIFYIESQEYIYIYDIYHTQDDMDRTMIELARRIAINKSQEGIVEANNGGRFYRSQVENKVNKDYKWYPHIRDLTQTKNKDTRIFSNSANVRNYVLFPSNWEKEYPSAYREFTKYRRDGENEHDDFEDCLTGCVEQNKHITRINREGLKFDVRR